MFTQCFRVFGFLSLSLAVNCFQRGAVRSFIFSKVRLKQFWNVNIKERKLASYAIKPAGSVNCVNEFPSACQYIIANASAFESSLAMRKLYGVVEDPDSPQKQKLPIIYIAAQHKEYGTIGYYLNRRLERITMKDVHPELRYLREQPVYAGGPAGSGSTFTMLHRKAGFPDNRPFKTMPGKPDFKVFYSPDVAMANELCSTNNALPSDFRFFQWSCVWLPGQLEEEHRKGFWTTFDGNIELLFPKDGDPCSSLYEEISSSSAAA